MATVDSPTKASISEEVDPTFAAGIVSVRPYGHINIAGKVFGQYAVFGQTAAILPAANAILGLCRWTDPTNVAAILRCWTTVTVVTAVTAQRTDPLVLNVARGYTVAETTNVTAVAVPGTANNKMRSRMGPSLMSSISVASAAAGMTGGTRTIDVAPIGSAGFGIGPALAGLGTGLAEDLLSTQIPGVSPAVLEANEGLQLTWGPTALATGTVTVGFGIAWLEQSSF